MPLFASMISNLVNNPDGDALRSARRQMVFQDPCSAPNGRLKIDANIAEPIRLHRLVPPGQASLGRQIECSYPYGLSSGLHQHGSIARPRLLIFDERTSIQASRYSRRYEPAREFTEPTEAQDVVYQQRPAGESTGE